MEFSPLYTQRLSGSSSRLSFNEDAFEQLEFNINDISRASSPASVTSTSARSEGHGSGFRERRHRSSGRGDDDYRRKYSRIKGELELERIKARQLQQERVEEMRKLREAFENDRKLELVSLQNRLEEDKKKELSRLKEELMKQKDFELQQVLMYKESERKQQGEKKTEVERETKKEKEVVIEHKKGTPDTEDEIFGQNDGDNDVVSTGSDKVRQASQRRTKVEEDTNLAADGSTSKVSKGTITTRVHEGGESQSLAIHKKDASVQKRGSESAHEHFTPRTATPKPAQTQTDTAGKKQREDKGTMADFQNSDTKSSTSASDGKAEVKVLEGALKADQVSNKKSSELETTKKQKDATESNNVLISLQEKIELLEKEKTALEKEKEAAQHTLEMKVKEHKIREQEFYNLKAGYDRELRTVINEHKKVALGNLEKLKQAETALKEATLSDEEIVSLSVRHDRQRRLSSSSLPSLQAQTKKEDKEREKQLNKKVSDLQSQIQRLERRINLLRTENDALRGKQDESRPLEDKIRSLKKRNAELASIARKLEEKAKALQQENAKVKSKSTSSVSTTGDDSEHLKRVFSRQRAKDLAEHAKGMLAKDKEIEELRRKCQELADLVSNGEGLMPQNASHFEEKEELINIIKQAAKERLQLEQQVAHINTKPKPYAEASQQSSENNSSNDKYKKELEEANQILNDEVEKLQQALNKTIQLESELSAKAAECQNLRTQLENSETKGRQLENQVREVTEVNQRLTSEVTVLQDKAKQLNKVNEECQTLKQSLAVAQKDKESAKNEIKELNNRVNTLEQLVKDLQASSKRADELENAHKLALSELKEKQEQLQKLQKAKSNEDTSHSSLVTDLKVELEKLEGKRKEDSSKKEELAKEIERLKEEADERQKQLEKANEERQKELEKIEAERQKVEAERQKALKDAEDAKAQLLKAQEELKLAAEREKEEIVHKMDAKPLTNQNDVPINESFLSAWAQKGPIQVYIAKYNYDPFEFSPNENPEAELPLTAGDYVLVVGEMDEDGFFDGELIDGRQGLVPSNFIEKVEDEDLAEFHAALMQAGHGDLSGISNMNNSSTSPVSLGRNSSNLNNLNNNYSKNMNELNEDSPALDESLNDLEDIVEIDEETASVNSRKMSNGGDNLLNQPLAPCPRGLAVDRKGNNSISVSWRGPEPSPDLEIQAYHLAVDGQFQTSVKSSEKTKTVLEGVSDKLPHRVSVRCISNKGQSCDAQCTMVIGKDEYPLPTDLRVSNLSPTACQLSWLPGNTNYQHAIYLDGTEVKVVKPGIFRHTLTGLTPGTLHKVTLIAKSISGTLNEEKSRKWMEKVSATIEFTTPVAGAPDPPLNVQMEVGPREGTIVLTWLPVTINSSGLSNGTQVSGYHVMANGKKVKIVQGPTTDHVVLSKEDFPRSLPSNLSVRTVSRSGVQSADSQPVHLSSSFKQKLSEKSGKSSSQDERRGHKDKPPSSHQKSEDTDEEIEAAFRDAHGGSSPPLNELLRPNTDSSTSELSDIPEVEEEQNLSQDSRLHEVGVSNSFHSYQGVKTSPKPAPRKASNQTTDARPKDFHDVKPAAGRSPGLLAAPTRVVPAIEITRDSSSEHGGPSFDDETDRDNSPYTPTSPAISSHHRDESNSAFRQVEQTNKPTETPPRPSHKAVGSPRQPTALEGPNSIQADEAGDNDSISGEIKRADPSNFRLFIALFDYDPITMSPNVDCIDEELPFKEGHIIKVFGDKDADGFYQGETQGRRGFVPCNMVSEVHIDDPELVEQLLRETSGQTDTVSQPAPALPAHNTEASTPTGEDLSSPSGVIPPAKNGLVVRKMIALYDYDPQELSPNVDAEVELSFKTGDIVMVYGDMDEDGFFTGEINGHQGLVPSNFLQAASMSDDEGLESASIVSPSRSRSGETFSTNGPNRPDLSNQFRPMREQRSTDAGSPTRPSSNMSPSEPNKGVSPSDSNNFLSSTSPDGDKPKKKTGFFNKSKNIFKKLTR